MLLNSREEMPLENQLRQMQLDAADDVSEPEAPSEESDFCEITANRLVKTIRAKQQPEKVPKLFVSNNCRFNCAYCGCRAGNDGKKPYCGVPAEIARAAVEDAVRNHHGIFVTSSIFRDADYTEELIIETIRIMREELRYRGYIHAKVMPGTDPLLIQKAGRYANRLSINLEVANSKGYELLAKQKNKDNILKPMYAISELIKREKQNGSFFATSQTTQIMAGSLKENDKTLLTLSEALYKRFGLSRVYYTAFHYDGKAAGYEAEAVMIPKWRVRRLYQADRLMQVYGFSAQDISPEEEPMLAEDIDPKLQWAFRHMELYPIEINTADYETLLRVPGIGTVFATRIISARRYSELTFYDLKLLKISMSKCRYFITCGGKRYASNLQEDRDILRTILTDIPTRKSEKGQ